VVEDTEKMTVRWEDDALLVRLSGPEVTRSDYVQELGCELLDLLDENDPSDLILDFRDIELLSSRMLGILVRLLKRTRETGTRLRLCCIQPRILHILELTNLDSVFDIHSTAEEALNDHEAQNKRIQ
jgi:anti-anti-sigma factor